MTLVVAGQNICWIVFVRRTSGANYKQDERSPSCQSLTCKDSEDADFAVSVGAILESRNHRGQAPRCRDSSQTANERAGPSHLETGDATDPNRPRPNHDNPNHSRKTPLHFPIRRPSKPANMPGKCVQKRRKKGAIRA
jgi:hypothetical protein